MDQFNTNYLTEQQVAEKYQISTRTLHNLRKAGKLAVGVQYFYLGKQIRYKSNVFAQVKILDSIF